MPKVVAPLTDVQVKNAKPKGMHANTYSRLTSMHNMSALASAAEMGDCLGWLFRKWNLFRKFN